MFILVIVSIEERTSRAYTHARTHWPKSHFLSSHTGVSMLFFRVTALSHDYRLTHHVQLLTIMPGPARISYLTTTCPCATHQPASERQQRYTHRPARNCRPSVRLRRRLAAGRDLPDTQSAARSIAIKNQFVHTPSFGRMHAPVIAYRRAACTVHMRMHARIFADSARM